MGRTSHLRLSTYITQFKKVVCKGLDKIFATTTRSHESTTLPNVFQIITLICFVAIFINSIICMIINNFPDMNFLWEITIILGTQRHFYDFKTLSSLFFIISQYLPRKYI